MSRRGLFPPGLWRRLVSASRPPSPSKPTLPPVCHIKSPHSLTLSVCVFIHLSVSLHQSPFSLLHQNNPGCSDTQSPIPVTPSTLPPPRPLCLPYYPSFQVLSSTDAGPTVSSSPSSITLWLVKGWWSNGSLTAPMHSSLLPHPVVSTVSLFYSPTPSHTMASSSSFFALLHSPSLPRPSVWSRAVSRDDGSSALLISVFLQYAVSTGSSPVCFVCMSTSLVVCRFPCLHNLFICHLCTRSCLNFWKKKKKETAITQWHIVDLFKTSLKATLQENGCLNHSLFDEECFFTNFLQTHWHGVLSDTEAQIPLNSNENFCFFQQHRLTLD